VLGPGPIGLLCARIAALAGARPLIVAGTQRDKGRLALGASETAYVDAEDWQRAFDAMRSGHVVKSVIVPG
jgi:threonine dehydrogenase-like Zn-dependent dehydrogenase